MKILVTGGAGYIGSHAVKALCDNEYEVVVIDNLSKGHKKAVDKRADFFKMDLADRSMLDAFFSKSKIDAVMHFAGSIEVGESMVKPDLYMQNNVLNGTNLLEAMRNEGVNKIIFSSTAAVYGKPDIVPIQETAELKPTNIYGFSKLTFENLLRKYDEFWGMKSVCLRYFNAAGADPSGAIGQDYIPDTHIIPRMIKSVLGIYDKLKVYGTDYKTPDGTCIRDYIHVTDLVDAHLKALDYLLKAGESDVFNLGNGNGFSVRQVINTFEKTIGKKVPLIEVERRPGDPDILVADSGKAKQILKWNPRFNKLEQIIETTWKWHSKNPRGFN